MASTYRLRVITPERTVFAGPVTFLECRSSEGEIGILARHMPMITPLVPHVAHLRTEAGELLSLAVGGGFLEVGEEQTVLLADSAEWPHEIDRERSLRARQRAEERLAKGGPEIDRERAKRALDRAEVRLRLSAGAH